MLIYSERETSIYFGCWESGGIPADYICQLAFARASAVRSFPREYHPYKVTGPTSRSDVLKVVDSDLHREHFEYRRRRYPTFVGDPSAKSHFVVCGHDIYHEVLAESFSEIHLPIPSLTDPRLRALSDWH